MTLRQMLHDGLLFFRLELLNALESGINILADIFGMQLVHEGRIAANNRWNGRNAKPCNNDRHS